MPTYDYCCPSCNKIEEQTHLISEDPEFKCSDCDILMKRMISINTSGFIMKGGSPAINYREKRQRKNNSEKMRVKQEKRWGGTGSEVAPNIAGVRTDSWSDAQRMAKEAGMNHESFTPYVEKEKKKKIIV